MEKIVELHGDGTAIVDMSFGERSVEARNLLAQVGWLMRYDGPEASTIWFKIEPDSIRQAAEWRMDRSYVLRRLRNWSGQSPSRTLSTKFYWETWRDALRVASQPLGEYSRTRTARKRFWTRLRTIQALWMRKAFLCPINFTSLPSGLLSAISRRESSWADLLRFADLDPAKEAKAVRRTQEGVESCLRSLKEQGLPINPRWLVEHGYHWLYTAVRRTHGSWETAVRRIGYDPDEERYKRVVAGRLSASEVLREILRRKIAGLSLDSRVQGEDRNLYDSAILHFESWRTALSGAGLDPDSIQRMSWSPEHVISSLRLLKANGESINSQYLQKFYPQLYNAIRKHLGSWEKAVLAAGFDPEQERQRYTRRWVDPLVELRKLRDAEEPINPGYLVNHRGLYEVLVRNYGSWSAGLEAAGYDPDKEADRPNSLKRR